LPIFTSWSEEHLPQASLPTLGIQSNATSWRSLQTAGDGGWRGHHLSLQAENALWPHPKSFADQAARVGTEPGSKKGKKKETAASALIYINLMKRSISILAALTSVSAIETYGEELKIWRLSDRFSLYSFNFDFQLESATNILDFMPVQIYQLIEQVP
jgi:hypothetical protein